MNFYYNPTNAIFVYRGIFRERAMQGIGVQLKKLYILGTPLLAPDFTHSNRFSARAKTVVKRSQIKSVLILLQPVLL